MAVRAYVGEVALGQKILKRMAFAVGAAALLSLLVGACGEDAPAQAAHAADRDAEAATDAHEGLLDGGADGSALEELTRKCGAPLKAQPGTIAEVVELLNQASTPTISCLLARLPRPLSLVAAQSTFSAQPSAGRVSPRVFVMLPGVVLSVVPTGRGAQLLELGELVTETRSLKGELVFPLERPLDDDAPYGHLRTDGVLSVCGSCHPNESPSDVVPGAFVSDAFQPSKGTEVTLEELRALRDACSTVDDAEPQCELLGALLDHGVVLQGAFPDDTPTIL